VKNNSISAQQRTSATQHMAEQVGPTGLACNAEYSFVGQCSLLNVREDSAGQGTAAQGRTGQGPAGQGRAGFLTSSPGSNRVHHGGVWQCYFGINTCCFGMVRCQAIILQKHKAQSMSSTDGSVRGLTPPQSTKLINTVDIIQRTVIPHNM
jgi:hypothetical protein